MNINKIFFIVIIFAITSCGFQPVHYSMNTRNFVINEIIEEGDHDLLLSLKNSYYSQLWNIQTGKQKL